MIWVVKVLLLVVVAVATAFADWTRLSFDSKGGGEDRPTAQPLRYFIKYPSLHDVSGDFCYLCTEKQRRAAAKKEIVRADVLFLGRFNGRAVYDILYYFDNDPKPAWKSLVVEKGRGKFGEVLQVHEVSAAGAGIIHSKPITAGAEQLICSRDNCDRPGCCEACFRIERTDPYRVDVPPSEEH